MYAEQYEAKECADRCEAGFVALTPTLVQVLGSAASASAKITYGYDALNRLVSTTYGDGSPAIGRSYTADGLLAAVSVSGTNASTWSYSYTNRRQLKQETLTLAAGSTTTATFTRSHDANAHLSQLGYPDGTVSYAPNALGQPTQVSGYASGVSWAPNGALAGFTYANGIAHSVSHNTRGLPLVATDAAYGNRGADCPRAGEQVHCIKIQEWDGASALAKGCGTAWRF